VHRQSPTAKPAANVAGLLKLLGEANVIEPEHAKRLLKQPTHRSASRAIEGQGTSIAPPQRLLDCALAHLRKTDPHLYNDRMEELSYLANVMMAAPQNQRRRLRPVEALESVLRITNRGLEMKLSVTARQSNPESLQAATAVLGVTTADCLFRQAFGDMSNNAELLPGKTWPK
jgi:hypothetical protein